MWTHQLQCKGRVVAARTVFVGDNLPELGADLVAALAALDVDDLAHGCLRKCCFKTCGARQFILPALLFLGLPHALALSCPAGAAKPPRAWGGVRRLGMVPCAAASRVFN